MSEHDAWKFNHQLQLNKDKISGFLELRAEKRIILDKGAELVYIRRSIPFFTETDNEKQMITEFERYVNDEWI